MQAKFRSATVADIGALTDLENRSFLTDRISRSSFRRLISSPSAAVIVAAVGSVIAGYAAVLFREKSGIARLYSLAVDPEYRGLGRDLLGAAEKTAMARGRRAIRLEVRDDNLRAVNLYTRAGYRCFGKRLGYYEDGGNALRFERELAATPDVARLAGTAAA
jgi:ribosomal-protein-alanine N-acetyltransferase